MAVTNQEITSVLAHIENAIHSVNKIDSDSAALSKNRMVETITLKDIDVEKKKEMAKIVKSVKFLAIELNVDLSNISAYTRQNLIDLGVLSE